jgi:hypothetical protein
MRNVALLIWKRLAALLALIFRWLINNPMNTKGGLRMLGFVSFLDIEMAIGAKNSNVSGLHDGGEYTP